MEVYIFVFSFLICFVSSKSSEVISNGENGKIKNIPAVDALISRLEQEQWASDDGPCLRTTLDMLWGVKNNTLWATWVWDSMQPPTGSFFGSKFHMGNYDQCLHAPWSQEYPALQTQYCLVDVMSKAVETPRWLEPFDNADEYILTPTKDSRFLNEQVYGVCLPASCSPSSVAKISRHLHQLTHLPDGDVYVDHRDCRKAGEIRKYSQGFYIFWTLIGMLVATAAYSTFCDNEGTTHTTYDIITKSFCIRRNYNALFKVNSDEIKVMNGMRFITAAMIVMVHETFFTVISPVINGLKMDEMMASPLGLSLMHSEVAVDTFFAMSGLLLVRGLLMGKQRNVFFTLVKRYLRLIGPVVVCILYITTAVEYMDDGPFWSRITRDEKEVCEEHWWRSVLMANMNVETMCYVITWYVNNDFQLAILATFLFCLFRKNRRIGVIAFLAVSMGLTLNLAWMVYHHKLDILPFGLKAFLKLRKNTALNYTYMNSCSRAGPYLVGMGMGYIITTYRPRDYRNIIHKKWSVVITISSLATMGTVLSVGSIFAPRPYDPLEAAVVVATNRTLWGFAICCIIGVCEYGTVPIVSDVLSWRGFVPLSKLTYSLYLLHPFIIQKQKYSTRTGLLVSYYNMIVNAHGVIVLGCMCSLGLYLILEAPLINLSNALFTEQSKPIEQNGINKETDDNVIHPDQNGSTKAKIL